MTVTNQNELFYSTFIMKPSWLYIATGLNYENLQIFILYIILILKKILN